MKKIATKSILGLILAILIGGLGYWQYYQSGPIPADDTSIQEKVGKYPENEKEPENEREAIKERNEYFFKLLRDPATNAIPENVRVRELKHAKSMPTISNLKARSQVNNSASATGGFVWQLAGPSAVGGRTRALSIDQRNSDILIAGAVSGGIWRSTDGGENWTLRTPDFDSFSVTSLAQDPTDPDTWYYVAGELLGNSASAQGAPYSGTGVFRSTDNGKSWSRIPGTSDLDATAINSRYDDMSRITVSPTTGTVFVASNGVGILRSSDGSDYDDITLGGLGEHLYADVAVAQDGTVMAVLGTDTFGASSNNPGIFVSNDDGDTWKNITPSNFPNQYFRSVVGFAPSNSNIAYVFSNTAQSNGSLDAEEHSFFKFNLADSTSEDRSNNLPDFGGPVGYTATQNGYDMDIQVKPDDPDFVTIGTINLYRSRDGFATGPSGNTSAQRNEFWIGGYAKSNNVSLYPNQHPDEHIQVYDPTDPDRLFVGSDGGISVTNNVEANSVSWENKDESYIVTQFYDASLPTDTTDNRLMGGTQDNGTPLFNFDTEKNIIFPSDDISSGDGAYSAFTKDFIFVSTPNGRIRRCPQDQPLQCRNGGPGFSFVHPSQASGQLFIHPYVVDPNNDEIMYYPSNSSTGSTIFRNTKIGDISSGNSNGTTQGWNELPSTQLPSGYIISTLSVTKFSPSNRLYYAGSLGGVPVIKRLDNANSSNNTPVDISIDDATSGAFVNDIAVNPGNGNDLLAVMTNYNIVGLYHSSNGGNSWEAVEGNLQGGSLQNNLEFGPSIRAATIISAETGPIYLLATSTGVYATQNLDGNNTEWGRESPFNNDSSPDIGFSVMEDITSRVLDGKVAIGSHGRGMFTGSFQGTISFPEIPNISINPTEARVGEQVTITATDFQFSSTPSNNDVFFGSKRATVDQATTSQLVVTVPSGAVSPSASDRSVLVSVTNNNGQDPQGLPFTILRDAKISINPTQGRVGDQVTISATNFQFSSTASDNDVFFANSKATVVQASPSQLTVEVPSVSIDPDASQRSVLVSVKNNNGPDPQDVSFTVLNTPVITIETPSGGEAQGQPGDEVTITAKSFKYNSEEDENNVYFDDDLSDNDKGVRAEVVNVSSDNKEITVEVPRGALEPTANDREVKIRVIKPDGRNPDPIPFIIQPPEESSIGQNYPNPFRNATTIPLNLKTASKVTLAIYDVSGRRVNQPVKDQSYQAGTYDISVNFGGKASGIYIYRVIAEPTGDGDRFVDSKKMTYIK